MTTAAELEAEAARLDAAAHVAAHRHGTRDFTVSIHDPQARALRARAAELRNQPGATPAPAPPPAVQARAVTQAPPDTRSREDKIRLIASGAPYPLDAAMVDHAIADGTAVDAFAVAVAGHCNRARAAAQREAEIDAVAARIAGFVPAARPAA